MPQYRDYRWVFAALILAIGFFIHYRNKWLQKNRPSEELKEFSPPSVAGVPSFRHKDRPNDPATKRFDTGVFVLIVTIIVVAYIMNHSHCAPIRPWGIR